LAALGPEPFDLQVAELIYCEEKIMGVCGIVTKPTEIFDGFWCCCLLRNIDDRNFTDHWGDYLVWISEKKPEVLPEPYPIKPLGDWVVIDKSAFCWGGYGALAESIDWVRDVFDRTMLGRDAAKKSIDGNQ
jgi:hypothetical protein